VGLGVLCIDEDNTESWGGKREREREREALLLRVSVCVMKRVPFFVILFISQQFDISQSKSEETLP
jgi:hypothetical protein